MEKHHGSLAETEPEVEGDEDPSQYVVEALEEEDYLNDEATYPDVYEEEPQEDPLKDLKASFNSDSENHEPVALIDRPANKKARMNFRLHGTFFKRRFVGETSGSQVAYEVFNGNTVDEILRGVWRVTKPILCREVVFIDDNGVQIPTWADGEPVFEDMSKYVIMQDQAQKRRVNIDKVDSKVLVTWRTKDIRIHLHIYSTSVSCKSLWDMVDKHLVRHQNPDRSGAPNNVSLTTLANELREKHGHHFSGHSSSWKLWANFVHSAPAHERERRMSEMPPDFLMKFFGSVPISEAVKLNVARSGLSVANTINDGFASELAELEAEADQLIAFGERLKHRINGMRTRSDINSSLVSAMQDSIRPEENELSRTLASFVSDMPDVDHS